MLGLVARRIGGGGGGGDGDGGSWVLGRPDPSLPVDVVDLPRLPWKQGKFCQAKTENLQQGGGRRKRW